MRANLLKAAVFCALLAILLGMPLLLTPHRIRPAIFAHIHVGMTEAEIVDLLGSEAANHDGYVRGTLFAGGFGGDPMQKTWCSRHGCVVVFFDKNKCVSGRMVGASTPNTFWARQLHRFMPTQNEALLREIAWTR